MVERRARCPDAHPDGRIAFLYRNRQHLAEGELREVLGIAAGGRRLNRKQAVTAAYLVEQVQRRHAGQGGHRHG